MLERGLNVALGSDGSLSSDNQDMFEAMRLAGLVTRADPEQRPRTDRRGRRVERATLAGARGCGCPEELGALEPGRRADLVLLRGDSAFLSPRSDLLNALAVFAETGASVDTVLIDGRIVPDTTGRQVDEPAIRAPALERRAPGAR